jgi:archaellum component FlaC
MALINTERLKEKWRQQQGAASGYTYTYSDPEPAPSQPGVQPVTPQSSLKDIVALSAQAETVQQGFAALDAALAVVNENVKTNNVDVNDLTGIVATMNALLSDIKSLNQSIIEASNRNHDTILNSGDSIKDQIVENVDRVNGTVADLASHYDKQVSLIRQILTAVQGFPSEIEKVMYQCSLVSNELAILRDTLRDTLSTMKTEIISAVVSESETTRAKIEDTANAMRKEYVKTETEKAVKADKRTDYMFTFTAGLLALKALGDICSAIFKKE